MTQTYIYVYVYGVNNILYSICLTLYFFFYIIVTYRHFASASGFVVELTEQRSLICRCVCFVSVQLLACGIIRINPFFWDLSSSYTYTLHIQFSIFEFFALYSTFVVYEAPTCIWYVWRNVKELYKFMKGYELVAWEISHLLIAQKVFHNPPSHIYRPFLLTLVLVFIL